ncbi:MAG: glycosyltransferase, partial [Gammaproteobacteria bacterium]|nr:glycosyltransferase [Gammaproteobacteria bacterium]
MKILFFANGKSPHTKNWIEEIADRGAKCYLVTDQSCDLKNTEVIQVKGETTLNQILAIPAVRKITNKLKPDIVHSHYITSYGLWGRATRKHPFVMTPWGSDILVTPNEGKTMQYYTKVLLQGADLITVNTEQIYETVHEYVSSSHIERIQWGINVDSIEQRKFRTNGSSISIASLRFWEPIYRISKIVDAFDLLVKDLKERTLTLYLLGGGSQEKELKEQVKRLNLTERVKFVGFVPAESLGSFLSEMDFSISLARSDGTPVSMLECMAHGVEVIAADLPSIRHWVGDDRGTLVDGNNVVSVYKGLKESILNSHEGKNR